jgi:hypothetical protein
MNTTVHIKLLIIPVYLHCSCFRQTIDHGLWNTLTDYNYADCHGSRHLKEATLAHVPGLKAAAHVNSNSCEL